MAVAAFIVMPMDFPVMEAVRPFVTVALFAWLALRWRSVVPLVVKGWWAFGLAALCALSVVWAGDPVSAMRHAGLLGIATALGAGIAARLDARQVAVAVLISQGVLAVASAMAMTTAYSGGVDGGGYALVGVFPQKNVLGQRMVFLGLAATVILLDRGYGAVWRGVAVVALLLAIWLIALSLSASAAILLVAGLGAVIGVIAVWRPLGRVRGGRAAVMLCGIAVLAGAALIALNVFGADPIGDALAGFGKDRTLTGRTDLWAVGRASIEDHPVLGVGAGSFWQPTNYAAVRVADQFSVNPLLFSFHNMWVEVQVHLGAVGLVVAGLVFGRSAGFAFAGLAVRHRRMEPLYIALAAVFLIRSFVESELFYGLTMGPILFWIVVFAAMLETSRAHRWA